MSKTFYETLIKEFKRSSQPVKDKKATKYGFSSSEEYLKFLEDKVNGVETYTASSDNVKQKKKVLIIDVLDRSISMEWQDRIKHAIEGIKKSTNNLIQENGKDVDYAYSLRDFGDKGKGKEILNKPVNLIEESDLTNLVKLEKKLYGSTALNDAIIKAVDVAHSHLKILDNVLINIYTDGEENSSFERNKQVVKNIIKKAEDTNRITITFIGVNDDVRRCTEFYGINETNTLVYDGTGEGLGKAMQSTMSARSAYSTKVAKGEEVKTGFYKSFNKK